MNARPLSIHDTFGTSDLFDNFVAVKRLGTRMVFVAIVGNLLFWGCIITLVFVLANHYRVIGG